MARPIKPRRICEIPQITEFCPAGGQAIQQICMTVDEFEAIRLIDYLGYSQEDCALQMKVARTTVQAIYESARYKTAAALAEGKRLLIEGGSYELCSNHHKCCSKNCRMDHSTAKFCKY